jgi:hypothetical protein
MLDHPGSSRSFPSRRSVSSCPHSHHTSSSPSGNSSPSCCPKETSTIRWAATALAYPTEVVFEKLVEVLVFGCAYHRIADEECSATTLRDRRDEWIEIGAMDALREIVVLEAYDRYIGLELSEVAVDCCITKAPCGGQKAGRSPVDRGKQGIKRSTAVDGEGIPIGGVTDPANRHDSPLLAPTLDHACASVGALPEGSIVHLDRGYDSELTRERLRERALREPRSPGRASPHRLGQRSAG